MSPRRPRSPRRYDLVRGVLPWPLYRFARNVGLDLLSLPRRFRGDEPGPMPWLTLHNHGGADFYVSARQIAARAAERLNLAANAHVLDIGCGTGRAAWGLAAHLGPEGAYTGVDVSRPALRFARRLMKPIRPDFVFEHADIANGEYNPRGALQARDYRLPCADGWADAVIANSLFTHLETEDASAFLREIARVLTPEGRAYITVFLVNDVVLARLEAGLAPHPLEPAEPPLWVCDPDIPEVASGFDEPAFRAMFAEAGLTLARDIERGSWSGETHTPEFQDILVLKRASAAGGAG